MFTVNTSNPLEFLLGILFVLLVFGALVGTVVVFFAYIFGNARDRWPDLTRAQRIQLIRKYVLRLTVFSVLFWIAMQRMPGF
jgi:hypothetical protein